LEVSEITKEKETFIYKDTYTIGINSQKRVVSDDKQGVKQKMVEKTKISFASLLDKNIYQNRDVLYDLQPPTGFLHRVDERNELVIELMPILLNKSATYLFVYGTPGTGKTGLMLDVMDELKKEGEKQDISMKSIYVNCSENRTETSILVESLNQLNPEAEYSPTGWNSVKATNEIINIVNKMDSHVVVVLDEVDYALKESGDDILMRLIRIKEKTKKGLSIAIISNDVRVADYMKPRTLSRITRVKIIFPPYNADELYDIIKDRANNAFKKGVVSDAVLKKIAEIEGSTSGDARKAIEFLDACAKIAISGGSSNVTLDFVEKASNNLERDHVIRTLTDLTKHQKILFLTILKDKNAKKTGTGVYGQYKNECKKYNEIPLSERRIRTFLVEFSELGLIQAEVGWLQDLRKKNRKITLNLDKAVKSKARKILRDSI